jgi:hypothetical protein
MTQRCEICDDSCPERSRDRTAVGAASEVRRIDEYVVNAEVICKVFPEKLRKVF